MAIDLSDPTIIAAIISIAGAFIVGVLALYTCHCSTNGCKRVPTKKRSSERGSIENSVTVRKRNVANQEVRSKQWRSWIF